MKDKATFQNKVKVLNKLFDSGCDTEKKLQQLDMEAILKIPNITIPDMGVIMELQKNTKSGKLFGLPLSEKPLRQWNLHRKERDTEQRQGSQNSITCLNLWQCSKRLRILRQRIC